ncbi:DnaA N-terminal domain-containing protein (plasmid) [Paenibacillus urinalis]|uniref:DnaA N-terminal domain-containing protein n=1 Tax=Paenibacillus urinalis TaxID=521520 RepID=A0ABY7XJS2_9BACL|nr:DnaA N-terminal domain-containing protein [Paenibacillus urinalis]WDI05036.1 DnaA N-terminal domain-containing protein [Paenibacillus urinalis]
MGDSTNDIHYFRYEKTGNKVPRKRKVNGESIEEMVEETRKIYYTEKDVTSYSLENLGLSLPYTPGNKTTVHNYLIKFWQYFLGPEATMTYINYLSLSFNESIPHMSQEHMAEMMGISRVTLIKYLSKLEDYGFVMRFWAESKKKKGMNDSTRVKVRQTVPFLSEAELKQLPEWLLLQHNRFMEKLFESNEVMLPENNDHEDEIKKLHEKGRARTPGSIEVTAPLEVRINKKREELFLNRTPQDIHLWSEIEDILKRSISAVTFGTWFKETFGFFEDNKLVVLAPAPFAAEWIDNYHSKQILNIFRDLTNNNDAIICVTTAEKFL